MSFELALKDAYASQKAKRPMRIEANHSGGFVGLHLPDGVKVLSEDDSVVFVWQLARAIAPAPLTVLHRRNPLPRVRLDDLDERPRFGETISEVISCGTPRTRSALKHVPRRAKVQP